MQQNFEGKAVIVTGSSKGIGETTAILFAKRGANVTVCGRNKKDIEKVVALCREASSGGKNKCISVCGDITDDLVQTETVNRTVEAFGRLDVLVANHGIIIPVSSAADVTPEDFDAVMNTNVKSTLFLIQKAIPHLEKTKGNVIVTSSASSKRAFEPLLTYSMSKASLDHMTRILALEMALKGVRVNSVNPGYTYTDMPRKVMGEEGSQQVGKLHPLLGRMGSTDDVAKVVTFLASDAASFVTGECIQIDGAFSILNPVVSVIPKPDVKQN